MTRMKLALLGAVLLGAGAVAAVLADEPAVFSHDLHVATAELECTYCHDTSAPELPALKTDGCGECHDGAPAAKLPAESRRLAAAFPHGKHVGKVGCDICHEPTIKETQTPGAPVLTPDQCFRCHKARKVATPLAECVKCHGRNQREHKPKSHDAKWRLRHGAAWRASDPSVHGADCMLCHDQKKFCSSCHQRTQPADHSAGWRDRRHGESARWDQERCEMCHQTVMCVRCHDQIQPSDHSGLWRVRTHGMAASWDRDSCRTCHETGTCIRCHSTTPPMNHNGAWLSTHPVVATSTRDESCTACHRTSFCDACHRRAR